MVWKAGVRYYIPNLIDKTIIVHLEHMSNYLIGRDPFEIKYFNQIVFDDYASRRGSMEIFSALSGIEQALWDMWKTYWSACL